MDRFDADEQLMQVRSRRAIARRRRRYRSRLDRFRAEIVELRHIGASIAELTAWLHARRCCVAASTVSRYIRKLPELSRV
jgi:arginine repressor